MSKLLGRELPTEVTDGLARPSKARDQALVLATVDEGLLPRLALLSLAEIAVVDSRRLLVALWADSNSAANFDRSGVATLFWVGRASAYSVLLRREETMPLVGGPRRLVAFAALVEDVRADQVRYARLASAITFELEDPSEVLPRWQDLGDRLAALAEELPAHAGTNEE